MQSKIFLAPMAGVTDAAFRILTREVTGTRAMMFTEMISSTGVHYKNSTTLEMLSILRAERPIAVQLFGSNPSYVGEAVEYVSTLENVDAIDFNLGCPAPKIVKNGEGSALMNEPRLVEELITSMRRATTLPIGVKMRLGFDRINAVEIARIVEGCGADWITVHGRTRTQFYSGRADWTEIARVKAAVGIPLIANGDVRDFDTFDEIRRVTGADGVMIGRGALGNPWLIGRLEKYSETGARSEPPSMSERLEVMRRHLELLLKFKGEYIGIREMRKHAAWYTKGLKGGALLRDLFNRAESQSEILSIIKAIEQE